MSAIGISVDSGIAAVTLNRPKVNAINEALLEELVLGLRQLEADSAVKAVVITGEGSFFSFGLDIPGFMGYSKEAFAGFIVKFADLLKFIFLFPKPVVAALNGHAVAGGCMIALAADRRLMASEKAKIALNEITFGSTVFASGVEMLKHTVGARLAERILFSGVMYSAEEAFGLGLIDAVAARENLQAEALKAASELAAMDLRAFGSVKKQLRAGAEANWSGREAASLVEFVEIWYSESVRKNLEKIKIKG